MSDGEKTNDVQVLPLPEEEKGRIANDHRERMMVRVSDPKSTFLLLASVTNGHQGISLGGQLEPHPAINFAANIFFALLGHDPNLIFQGVNAIAAVMKQREAKIVRPTIVVPGRGN